MKRWKPVRILPYATRQIQKDYTHIHRVILDSLLNSREYQKYSLSLSLSLLYLSKPQTVMQMVSFMLWDFLFRKLTDNKDELKTFSTLWHTRIPSKTSRDKTNQILTRFYSISNQNWYIIRMHPCIQLFISAFQHMCSHANMEGKKSKELSKQKRQMIRKCLKQFKICHQLDPWAHFPRHSKEDEERGKKSPNSTFSWLVLFQI